MSGNQPCKCIIVLTEDFENYKLGNLLHISQAKAQELVSAGVATDNPATVDAELSKVDFNDPNQSVLKEYAEN